MTFELLQNKKQIVVFDMIPGISSGFITKVSTGFEKMALQEYLFKRSLDIVKDLTDDDILKGIELSDQKIHFGRMKEAAFLYSVLHYFENNDGISVYPLQSELLCVSALDFRYNRIYLLHGRNENGLFNA